MNCPVYMPSAAIKADHGPARARNKLLASARELDPGHAGVPKGNAGEGSTPSRVVDDLPNHTLDVPLLLAEVEATELGSTLPRPRNGLEDAAVTLTLSADDASHLDVVVLARSRRAQECFTESRSPVPSLSSH